MRQSCTAKMIMAQYRSSGKELRKSPKGVIAAVLAICLAAGGAYGFRRIINGMEPLIADPVVNESELEVPEVSDESSEDPNGIKYGQVLFPEARIHQGSLVLVNRDYPIEDAAEGIVSVFEQRNEFLAVRDMEVYLLDGPMLELNRMAKDFYEETGLSDLMVINGYITKEQQKQLYESDLQRTGASSSDLYAIPGCSEFESGYSFELGLYQNGMFMDFTDQDDHAWILKHCAEYGFVQRYPEGKSEFTHEDNKPWVFRYVGTPHAWFMYKNNLCL
ncbi:MAG: M15 family metallopeptidase, partial [Oscillospiraceae bacterium]|nr:M15 family metallopeptidase [Oscillospiraceae bacterium]